MHNKQLREAYFPSINRQLDEWDELLKAELSTLGNEVEATSNKYQDFDGLVCHSVFRSFWRAYFDEMPSDTVYNGWKEFSWSAWYRVFLSDLRAPWNFSLTGFRSKRI